jgi:hypothetical protein
MSVGKCTYPIFLAILLILTGVLPAVAFETGVPLSFGIDPATVRQRADSDKSKVEATVILKSPSPAFFICQIRSYNADQISFPTIIFRKGDTKGKSDGIVHWKAVTRVARVRLAAYNADSPEMQLSFTVTLKPLPAPEVDEDQPDNGAGEGRVGNPPQ